MKRIAVLLEPLKSPFIKFTKTSVAVYTVLPTLCIFYKPKYPKTIQEAHQFHKTAGVGISILEKIESFPFNPFIGLDQLLMVTWGLKFSKQQRLALGEYPCIARSEQNINDRQADHSVEHANRVVGNRSFLSILVYCKIFPTELSLFFLDEYVQTLGKASHAFAQFPMEKKIEALEKYRKIYDLCKHHNYLALQTSANILYQLYYLYQENDNVDSSLLDKNRKDIENEWKIFADILTRYNNRDPTNKIEVSDIMEGNVSINEPSACLMISYVLKKMYKDDMKTGSSAITSLSNKSPEVIKKSYMKYSEDCVLLCNGGRGRDLPAAGHSGHSVAVAELNHINISNICDNGELEKLKGKFQDFCDNDLQAEVIALIANNKYYEGKYKEYGDLSEQAANLVSSQTVNQATFFLNAVEGAICAGDYDVAKNRLRTFITHILKTKKMPGAVCLEDIASDRWCCFFLELYVKGHVLNFDKINADEILNHCLNKCKDCQNPEGFKIIEAVNKYMEKKTQLE